MPRPRQRERRPARVLEPPASPGVFQDERLEQAIASSFQPSVFVCLRFELFLCERSEPKRASLSRFFSSILGTRIQGGRDAWTRPVAPPLRRRSIVASRALACCKHFVAHGLLSPRLFSSLPQTALTISGTASPAGRPCRRSNNAPVSPPSFSFSRPNAS